MIFFSLFKTIEGKTVTVELKNDLQVRGTLASVDHFMNFKLENVEIVDRERFPQLVRRPLCACAQSFAGVDCALTHPYTFAALGALALYPRRHCALRAPPARRCRHRAPAGRSAAGGDDREGMILTL